MVSIRLIYVVLGLVLCVIILNIILGRRAELVHNTIKPPIDNQFQIKNLSELQGFPKLHVHHESPKTQQKVQIVKNTNSETKSVQYGNISAVKQLEQLELLMCNDSIQKLLDKPFLSLEDIGWCNNALDPSVGKVSVGRSWGNLKTTEERNKFEKLNCNSVHSGKNPSCNDAWGDAHIRNWRKTISQKFTCGRNHTQIACFKNDINDEYCSITNTMVDFSKMHSVQRNSGVGTRKFDSDFISFDCNGDYKLENFKFNYLISSKVSSEVCDQYISGTTFIYSHDNIRNLCHTWNDVMNVWLMLWLERLADRSGTINLLTIDAMKLYNNFDDAVNEFFAPYRLHFKNIYRGLEFGKKRICFEKVVMQPLPSRGFVWENWHQDLPCSYVGPSSLFQRWNVQMRQSFGLIESATATADIVQVLLIVRRENKNDWGSYRTSRLLLNENDVIESLTDASRKHKFRLLVQDMANIVKFSQQVKLIADTSIVIAMHGAGLVQTMYMSIGKKNCCGVIEMFPSGEFTPVRGYANMIRKMGMHYDRIDVSPGDSKPEGAKIPISQLIVKLSNMLTTVTSSPSCVLPVVLTDPYIS